ncbi:MAG: TetR family transcriptional regulator [Clostridia bacterium]|nr:TetR family transcriptional regulator [Clostridia bacterium]
MVAAGHRLPYDGFNQTFVRVRPLPAATRDRRADVVSAARRLFSRKGYHATSMQDLGEALGVQRGSLYAHIDSKEELLYEIVREGADAFLEALRPVVERPAPAAEKLRAAYRAHVGVIARRLDAATVFFHEWRFLGPERRADVLARRDAYEGLWRRIVEEGVASGEFRPVDAKLAAIWLLSSANWLYQWYRPDGPSSAEEIADQFATLALNGLGAGGSRPAPPAEPPGA